MERPMVLSKRVGVILKEAREKRKLSIKDVAKETNITAKYVEALENEDFSQFPGDTYAFGFLRNYVDFLNMDVDQIMGLYKGQQIDQSPSPVKELTKQSSNPIQFRFPDINRKYLLYSGIVVFFVVLILLFITGVISLPSFSSDGKSTVTVSSVCRNNEIQDFTLPSAGAGMRGVFLDDKITLRFKADRHRIKFCLAEVVKDPAEGSIAKLNILVDDEKSLKFQVKERETFILTNKTPGFEGLARKILIRPTAIADYTTQLEFSSIAISGSENTNTQINTTNKNTGTGLIQVTLEFIQPSYISWVTDGQSHSGRTLNQGQTITLEAKSRLEIKIGNGAGVRIRRDGVAAKIAGRPAQIVTLSYRMIPDPLDPGIKKIQESIR